MTVLVLGATGQVGYELAAQLADRRDVLLTTRTGASPVPGLECRALDTSDLDAVARCIQDAAPRVVINATAHTAVDRAESEPEIAFRLNAEAPAAMAAACRAAGARFVHFSTDYVFDGSGTAPYPEDAPTAPLGVYGTSKLAGERAVRESGADALILRTAWVYGLRGHNFLRTMLRLGAERESLGVVDDQVGSPTPAWFIAESTLRLLDTDASPGTLHVVTRGRTSWHGFAAAIFEEAVARGLLARAPRLDAIPTAAYPTPARRPAFSVLDTAALAARGVQVPEWRHALCRTFERARGEAAGIG
ncbi:dTDP-4-dehydrorhamnose reductase [Lysobacter xanthus]